MTDPYIIREIIDGQISSLQRLRAELDEREDATGVPVVESPDHNDELISLRDAATLLGLQYDATRMRAKRAGAIVKVHPSSYVWRSWVNAQANVRSVRSCSVQRSPAFQTPRSVCGSRSRRDIRGPSRHRGPSYAGSWGKTAGPRVTRDRDPFLALNPWFWVELREIIEIFNG